jgi:glycosyltransferase involved in cell wall biosynthesis
MSRTVAKEGRTSSPGRRPRPTLTAAISALDEAANLAELLPRLDWVDEIVLVDGGSRDATVAIAEAHGCRVLRRAFDTFAPQRNAALDAATSDWVLWIDADDRPTPRLAAEIRRRIAHARHAAFRVPIRSTIFGRPLRRSGVQDDWPVRLARRDAGRWHGDVHEVLRVAGRIGRLDSWLLHRTQSTLDEFLRKMHHYTTLDARARVAAGRGPRRVDLWLAPAREVFRRLIYKQGLLDGPAGWAFCLLSGLYEYILARKHRRMWEETTGFDSVVSFPVAARRKPAVRDRETSPVSTASFRHAAIEEPVRATTDEHIVSLVDD